MIDIHSHILPGLDDGSQDMDKSVAMAEVAAEAGVTAMIATPHCNQKKVFENYASPELERKLESFRKELAAAEIELEIYPGAEVFATEDIIQLYREKKLMTLNNTEYMLVEFDFGAGLAFMERTLYSLLDEGLKPVLAHPERYYAVQDSPDAAMIWHDEGVGIQLNKGSLSGRFGRSAYHLANMLMESGHVSVIASDAHGAQHRSPDMTNAHAILSANFPEMIANLLLEENPRRIINNEPLLTMEDVMRY